MKPRRKIDWRDAAERLAKVVPRERLHPAPLVEAEKARRSEGWAVAFSGGADSLALLLLLWAHFPERREKLIALHYNHRLRGRAAWGDEQFCRRVGRSLEIEVVVGRRVGSKMPMSEATARELRFDFFAQALAERRVRRLWLGHQQDDIAETMMMRLARGSGSGGLAAPRPVQTMPSRLIHLRPLLTVKKEELVAALRALEVEWRDDASNVSGDYFRNRIRHSVLPAWRRAAGERDALAGAALARELLEEDDAALEAWLDEVRPWRKDGALDLAALAGKPRALQRRALHRWLLRQKDAGQLSRQGFAALLAAVERSEPTRQSLGTKGFAVIRARCLHFERARSSRT